MKEVVTGRICFQSMIGLLIFVLFLMLFVAIESFAQTQKTKIIFMTIGSIVVLMAVPLSPSAKKPLPRAGLPHRILAIAIGPGPGWTLCPPKNIVTAKR
jgi:hypothetical protein